MARVRGSTKANLGRQGFGYLDDEEMAKYAWPLRFTPAVGTALVAVGLIMESPWLLVESRVVVYDGHRVIGCRGRG